MISLLSFSTTRQPVEAPEMHKGSGSARVVLLADDKAQDYLLMKETFEASPISVDLRWVCDGEEALDYLFQRGDYRYPGSAPRPDLILLDLIMPGKGGLEILSHIKGTGRLRNIPVVLLATCRKQIHEASGLRLGADSFIVKPRDFDELANIFADLHEHYFGIFCVPDSPEINGFRCGNRLRSMERHAVCRARFRRSGVPVRGRAIQATRLN
ncbi:MAG: response regulator [Syntrophobacteraceae bacterium]